MPKGRHFSGTTSKERCFFPVDQNVLCFFGRDSEELNHALNLGLSEGDPVKGFFTRVWAGCVETTSIAGTLKSQAPIVAPSPEGMRRKHLQNPEKEKSVRRRGPFSGAETFGGGQPEAPHAGTRGINNPSSTLSTPTPSPSLLLELPIWPEAKRQGCLMAWCISRSSTWCREQEGGKWVWRGQQESSSTGTFCLSH